MSNLVLISVFYSYPYLFWLFRAPLLHICGSCPPYLTGTKITRIRLGKVQISPLTGPPCHVYLGRAPLGGISVG